MGVACWPAWTTRACSPDTYPPADSASCVARPTVACTFRVRRLRLAVKMTDWPLGRGIAASPAVFPAAADAPASNDPPSGLAALGAWALLAAARAGPAAVPMVAPAGELPAEHPAASTQAPAASRSACAAARRRGIGTETRCTGAF